MSASLSVSQASAEVELATNCSNKSCPGWMVHDPTNSMYMRLNCHFVCTRAHITPEQKANGYLPLKCDFGWCCSNAECCRAHYGKDEHGEDEPDVNICPKLFKTWFTTRKCDQDDCEYAHPEKIYKAEKAQPKIRRKKKPQELTDEEFEAMAAQNVVKPIATTNKKEVDKKTGGRFAALDDSPVEKQESTADDSTSEEIQRFAMTTPINVPVDIPEVSAEKRIVLTAENYKEQQPLLASLTWEQVEAIAKQVGAITVDEKQPIRVVKPKAVVDEFPSLGSAPVKKQSTGQWGAQNAVQRNAKWGEIAKEKAAREVEEKKRAEEKA
jgi:hypothetical protein